MGKGSWLFAWYFFLKALAKRSFKYKLGRINSRVELDTPVSTPLLQTATAWINFSVRRNDWCFVTIHFSLMFTPAHTMSPSIYHNIMFCFPSFQLFGKRNQLFLFIKSMEEGHSNRITASNILFGSQEKGECNTISGSWVLLLTTKLFRVH